MRKFTAILAAILITATAILPLSAAGKKDWEIGNGYLIDNVNAKTSIEETADGLKISYGGYWTDGKDWGGIVTKEKVDITNFSIEFRIDKLPDTDADTWFTFAFLQKPQMFQRDMTINMGIFNFVRWKDTTPYVDSRGPLTFSNLAKDYNDAFGFKAGDTVTVSIAKEADGKYYLTINGVKLTAAYDMSAVAPDGKAHFLLSSSMKNSPKDGFELTITKVNGKPAVEAATPTPTPNPGTTTTPATFDPAIIAVVVTAMSGAAFVVASKKRK